MDELSGIDARVSIMTNRFDTDQRYNLMMSADVIMLHYNIKGYGSRGSGPCNEATW